MSTATISILGDICPAFGAREFFDKRNPEGLLHSVLPVIRQSDLAIANFECPATSTTGAIRKSGPNLCAQEQDVELLKACGLSALSIANNHILDFGEQGVLDTLACCEQQAILTFGGGASAQQARQPLFVTVKGHRIGVLSFAEEEFNCATEHTAGANKWDPYESLDDIRNAKAGCDRLIVLYHGGIEHYRYPSPLLQKKCRKIVDAGADFVTCQHSHCIGTVEEYRGKNILYGQGNAIFGFRQGNERWNTGLLVQLLIADNNIKVRYLPMQVTPAGVDLMEEAPARVLLEEMYESSKAVYDSSEIDKCWRCFCAKNAAWYLPMIYGWGRS